jgi:hypothetical protein
MYPAGAASGPDLMAIAPGYRHHRCDLLGTLS